MDDSYFVSLARESACKSLVISEKLRRYATPKGGSQSLRQGITPGRLERKDSIIVQDDVDLLFTADTLKQALDAESISQLLQCQCTALCKVQRAKHGHTQDDLIIRWLQKQDRKAVAALVLSGCTFALRALYDMEKSLDLFLVALCKDDKDSDDDDSSDDSIKNYRQRLFESIRKRSGRTDISVLEIAEIFSNAVISKQWLMNIPEFEVTDVKRTFKEPCNMPFMNDTKLDYNVEGRKIFRFTIKDSYADGQLRKRELFRKEFLYLPKEDKIWKAQSNYELAVLKKLLKKPHENIARMLFAFEERKSPQVTLSLVFDYHECDLGKLLHLQPRDPWAVRALRPFNDQVGTGASESLVDHGLWKATLNIIDAIDHLHREFGVPVSPFADRNLRHTGHFDIKPGNILVDTRDAKHPKLLLTDFGEACLGDYPEDVLGGWAYRTCNPEYAPPETSRRGRDDRGPSRPYDIWAVACILLEVMAQLHNGSSHAFRSKRSDLASGAKIPVFWTKNEHREVELNPAVSKKLAELREDLDAGSRNVLSCITKMLSLEPSNRPELKECSTELRATVDAHRHDWAPSGGRPLMDPELAQMHTSCWRNTFAGPRDCRLTFWRDEQRDPQQRMWLDIQCGTAPQIRETVKAGDESIVPLTFFERHESSGQLAQGTSIDCAFQNLHRDTILQFRGVIQPRADARVAAVNSRNRLQDFRDFFSLLTYQRIMSTSFDLCFTECQITEYRPLLMNKKPKTYASGRVQVWNTYDELEYEDKFAPAASDTSSSAASQSVLSGKKPRKSSLAADDRKHVSDARHSRFKIAIFLYPKYRRDSDMFKNEDLQARCIIFEAASTDVGLDPRSQGTRRLAFQNPKAGRDNNFFRIATFVPTVPVQVKAGSPPEMFPAIPISPRVLRQRIAESKEGVARIELTFASEEDQRKLWTVLKRKNIL